MPFCLFKSQHAFTMNLVIFRKWYLRKYVAVNLKMGKFHNMMDGFGWFCACRNSRCYRSYICTNEIKSDSSNQHWINQKSVQFRILGGIENSLLKTHPITLIKLVHKMWIIYFAEYGFRDKKKNIKWKIWFNCAITISTYPSIRLKVPLKPYSDNK